MISKVYQVENFLVGRKKEGRKKKYLRGSLSESSMGDCDWAESESSGGGGGGPSSTTEAEQQVEERSGLILRDKDGCILRVFGPWKRDWVVVLEILEDGKWWGAGTETTAIPISLSLLLSQSDEAQRK